MINDFLPRLSIFKHDFIYDLISHQNLNTCLDVGAAAGLITKKIKLSGSLDTKVIAFEPFSGNHNYFIENTQELNNIELVKKAVSNESGLASFFVPSVVSGNEKDWENMQGYSSVGYLVENTQQQIKQNLKQKIKKIIKQILKSEKTNEGQKNNQDNYLKIETVAIDDIISEHLFDFMKIDVQGGEYNVLKGAENTIKEHGIDLIYLEFTGDSRILNFLEKKDYIIFDTDYMIIPKVDLSTLEDMGFYDLEAINLSTGKKAYTAKLLINSYSYNYCYFLKEFSKNCGYIQTDMICVHRSFINNFMININKLISKV